MAAGAPSRDHEQGSDAGSLQGLALSPGHPAHHRTLSGIPARFSEAGHPCHSPAIAGLGVWMQFPLDEPRAGRATVHLPALNQAHRTVLPTGTAHVTPEELSDCPQHNLLTTVWAGVQSETGFTTSTSLHGRHTRAQTGRLNNRNLILEVYGPGARDSVCSQGSPPGWRRAAFSLSGQGAAPSRTPKEKARTSASKPSHVSTAEDANPDGSGPTLTTSLNLNHFPSPNTTHEGSGLQDMTRGGNSTQSTR